MQKAIIIDLDGTLYNCEARRAKYLSGDKKNFDLFNAEHVNDRPNEWCAELINCIQAAQCEGRCDAKIIYVSGRDNSHYESTANWITDNTTYHWDEPWILMRKPGDYRSDVEIKQEIYDIHIKDKYDVLFAIDDRQCIVDMWRRNGIVCLQCAPGDF